MAGVDYRYELRRGEEVVATGRLNYEQPLEVGDRIEIAGLHGIVNAIEPVLRERELRGADPLLSKKVLYSVSPGSKNRPICGRFFC